MYFITFSIQIQNHISENCSVAATLKQNSVSIPRIPGVICCLTVSSNASVWKVDSAGVH